MGCPISKLDDEEAVKICKDRKNFIKQAVEQRQKFAARHVAYVESMNRVSATLQVYINGDDEKTPGFVSSMPDVLCKSGKNSPSYKLNFYRTERTPSVLVEERVPESPKTCRVETYSPGYSSFFQYSPNNMPSYPPPSPSLPASQWDLFWNLFSSFDYYGYHTRSSSDAAFWDEGSQGVSHFREEEKIPQLVEEVNKDVEESKIHEETEKKMQQPSQVAETHLNQKETALANEDSKDETPGFTVYVNRKHTTMTQVINDIECQFMAACEASSEMSSLLEPNDLSGKKMLNPVTMFSSGSSRSPSSKLSSTNAVSSKGEGYECSSGISKECLFSESHQSSLDRLYVWEKKLHQQVRAGERIRLEYEKKCAQLKNQDGKGEDSSFDDKTEASIRDLQTQIRVSIHSVETISKRIESLRDEELEPQLEQMLQGLARMWKVMAECHQLQKRTLDEAKVSLASKLPSTKEQTSTSASLAPHATANLETEIRNWRACFNTWIISQRSYVHALTGWLLRCVSLESETLKSGAPTVFSICIQWSRLLDSMKEASVLEGMDLFAAGIGSLYSQQCRQDSRSLHTGAEPDETLNLAKARQIQDGVTSADKTGNVAAKVVCAGLSFAVNALTDFALTSAQGYADLIRDLEIAKEQTLH